MGGRGRDAQVVEALRVVTELPFDLRDRVREVEGTTRLAHVGQAGCELLPLVVGHGVSSEFVQRSAGVRTESGVVQVVERSADDPAFGEEPGA